MNDTDEAVKEKIKVLDLEHNMPPDAPICKVWGWHIHSEPFQWITADYFEDHPRLGSGRYIRTTRVIWLSRELGMARTLNTLYKLMGPEA